MRAILSVGRCAADNFERQRLITEENPLAVKIAAEITFSVEIQAVITPIHGEHVIFLIKETDFHLITCNEILERSIYRYGKPVVIGFCLCFGEIPERSNVEYGRK